MSRGNFTSGARYSRRVGADLPVVPKGGSGPADGSTPNTGVAGDTGATPDQIPFPTATPRTGNGMIDAMHGLADKLHPVDR